MNGADVRRLRIQLHDLSDRFRLLISPDDHKVAILFEELELFSGGIDEAIDCAGRLHWRESEGILAMRECATVTSGESPEQPLSASERYTRIALARLLTAEIVHEGTRREVAKSMVKDTRRVSLLTMLELAELAFPGIKAKMDVARRVATVVGEDAEPCLYYFLDYGEIMIGFVRREILRVADAREGTWFGAGYPQFGPTASEGLWRLRSRAENARLQAILKRAELQQRHDATLGELARRLDHDYKKS